MLVLFFSQIISLLLDHKANIASFDGLLILCMFAELCCLHNMNILG